MRSDGRTGTCGRPKRNGQPCDNHPDCAWHRDPLSPIAKPMTPGRARRELLVEVATLVAKLADNFGIDTQRLEALLKDAADE